MKKFISMVMAAAMVVSLVPATAFAAGDVTATARVVDALELTRDEARNNPEINETNYEDEVPEVQLRITDVDYRQTNSGDKEVEVTFTLDNAEFLATTKAGFERLVRIVNDRGGATSNYNEYVRNDAGQYMYMEGQPVVTIANEVVRDVDGYDAIVALVAAGEAFDFSAATGDVYVGSTKVYTESTDTKEFTDATIAEMLQKDGNGFVDSSAAAVNVVELDSKQINDANVDTTFEVDGVSEADVVAKYVKLGYYRASLNTKADGTFTVEATDWDDDFVTYTITGEFEEDYRVIFDVESKLTKTSEGTRATVSVESDMVDADDLVYVSVLGQGISASTRSVGNVAEEERTNLSKDLKIKSAVGDFKAGQEFELRLSKGFEFSDVDDTGKDYKFSSLDDNKVTLTWQGADTDEITIAADDIEIEAVSAKSGATATLTVKAIKDGANTFAATTTVEVLKVVDYKVELSVDEDEDVPVIYSGVNVDNDGITDDSDHISLEVTAEETFPGAWSMRKGFSFELPEGVYVTDVDVKEAENFLKNDEEVDAEDWEQAFFDAYQDGNHVNFEFEKRVFDDVNVDLQSEEAKVTFTLELVADPDFEGDVTLKLTGDLVDEQEVVIATFVKPYTVTAQQNDLIIDYRYTAVPTNIVITEAEGGLWEEDAVFEFVIEKGNLLQFEDDATFTVDEDSELEIDDFTGESELNGDDDADGVLGFTIDSESDEAATVTISDIQLFMQRNIPAGAYDLSINTSLAVAYEDQLLFAPDCEDAVTDDHADTHGDAKKDDDCFVGDVCDYSDTVKEAFVNVVTAGRDQDDASFTTKVVVPVGESYLIAGETQVALDVPAYINADGYTMLPVRAVATALGINNNNVLWDQATKTVTILYGQRIITMVAGQKTVYVNGSAIPASSAVEIVDGRTFLPMRDLATALGVTDITWDASTRTATLNGNQK